MSLYKLRLPPHWIHELETKPETGVGYQKVHIYFNDGTILNRILVTKGDEIRTQDIETYNTLKSKLDNIKHMQVVREDVEDEKENNNMKGNMIMEKQQITKFIKNLVDDNYAEANKTLVDIVNLKVQNSIKNEIITQEKDK